MGHHQLTSQDLPAQGEHIDLGRVSALRKICFVIMLLGGIGSFLFLIGGSLMVEENNHSLRTFIGSYSYSWLWAFFFFLTIALGGCFWVLLHHLSNSGWGTSVRRVMENVGYVFPFLAVLGLPLLVPSVQAYLYEWTVIHWKSGGLQLFDFFGQGVKGELAKDPHNALLVNKVWYMNLFFWFFRVLVFSGALMLVIKGLRSISIAQDTDPNPTTKRLFQARNRSSWGMIIFGVTITFLAIDLIKGIDYKWFSTMFGVYVFAGSALNSMVVILLVTILLRRAGYLKQVVTEEHDHIMGKLIFAFTVFWAYVSFSQFFLYWYANITEETSYFLLRNTEHWNTVSILLVAGHFFAPFLAMIRQDVKKNHRYMTFMVGYLLVMHALDTYHMIIPERAPSLGLMIHGKAQLWFGSLGPILGDLLAFLIVGSAFTYFLLRNIGSASLYPSRDPRILESANLQN